MSGDIYIPRIDTPKPAAQDNLDDIARSIAQDLRKHGGGAYRVDLAAGGALSIEVVPDGGISAGSKFTRVDRKGRPHISLKHSAPGRPDAAEVMKLRDFLRVLPEFLRQACTPRPIFEL